MINRWGTNFRKILYNLEIYGVPNAEQQTRINNGEVLGYYWNDSEMQQQPIGPWSGVTYAAALAEHIPWAKCVRLPFNKYSWDVNGLFTPFTEELLSEFKTNGIEVLFPLMDGPSQKTPTGVTVTDWYDYIQNTVGPSQTAGHLGLKAWLDANAATRPVVYAIEAINEPNSYSNAAIATDDLNSFLTAYVDHVLAIWAIWETSYPTVQFLVDGWKYAKSTKILDTYLPSYGKTAAQAIRDAVGSRLIWSLHLLEAPATWEYVLADVGTSLSDRIIWTESHARGNHVDQAPPVGAGDTINIYNFGASGEFFARYDTGLGWWTGSNYGKARLLNVANNGTISITMFGAFSSFLHVSSYGQHPDFFTGPEFGNKTPVLKTVYAVYNPGDAYPVSPWPTYTTCFGGRGVCVIQGLENTNNSLHGGDGWNVLYGAQTAGDDHLYLGRGGGVIRTYQGSNRIVTSSHSPGLVYTGAGKDVVTFPKDAGSSTLIMSSAATAETWLWGFNPARGDRISFRGAFANPAALLAATTVIDAGHFPGQGGLIDVRVVLPSGGTLTIQNAAPYAGSLSDYTKDFTDGWYQGGWTEPADYDPNDLTVDPGPPTIDWYPTDANLGGPTQISSKSGQQILARKKDGSVVQIT